MRCARCTFENAQDATKCTVCGASFEGIWVCPTCTGENVGGSTSCQVCGAERVISAIPCPPERKGEALALPLLPQVLEPLAEEEKSTESTPMGILVEEEDMEWICSSCTFAENPPGSKVCAVCSRSRDFPPEPEPEKPKQHVCPACTFGNASGATVCEFCATPLLSPAVEPPSLDQEGWTCAACTTVNTGSGAACSMCQQPRLAVPSAPPSEEPGLPQPCESEDKTTWICTCTLVNAILVKECPACGTLSPSESMKKKQEDEMNARLTDYMLKMEQMQEELARAREKAATSSGCIPALRHEKEAMASGTLRRVLLRSKRSHSFDNPEELHYRYCESQFLRLTEGHSYHVTAVEYVINPPLMSLFNSKQIELSRILHHPQDSILAFHGTRDANIDSIVTNNFELDRLGDNSGDNGWYGGGIYFSEYTITSIGYNSNTGGKLPLFGKGGKKKKMLMMGEKKPHVGRRAARRKRWDEEELPEYDGRLLLCKVLLGNTFECPGRMDGRKLQAGYHSHISPCKKEIVVRVGATRFCQFSQIFDADQILPCYIVYYKAGAARVDH